MALVLARAPEKIGKIYVPDSHRDKTEMALQVGRVIAMSPLAFNYDAGLHFDDVPKPGDLVMIVRYGGGEFTGRDGQRYRMVKDRDIMGVILVDHLDEVGPKTLDEQAADVLNAGFETRYVGADLVTRFITGEGALNSARAGEPMIPVESERQRVTGNRAFRDVPPRHPIAQGGDDGLQPGRSMPPGATLGPAARDEEGE